MSQTLGSSTSSNIARSQQQPWVDLISGMYEDGASTCRSPSCWPGAATATCSSIPASCRTSTVRAFRESSASRIGSRRSACSPRSASRPTPSPTSSSRHAHFDHMGSIAEFPKARIIIQKSELLRWYEAIALPPQFGYLTAIIDPDNLRTAFDASIEHRVDTGRRRQGQCLARHPRPPRLGPHDGPAIRHRRNGARPAGGLRRLRLLVAARSPATTMTASTAAQQRGRQRLGPAQDHRQHQHRDRRRPREADHPARHRALEGTARASRRSRGSGSSRPRERNAWPRRLAVETAMLYPREGRLRNLVNAPPKTSLRGVA